MLLAISPFTGVNLSTGPAEDPKPMLLVILVAPLVLPPITPTENTIIAIHHVLKPPAGVDPAIGPSIGSPAANFPFKNCLGEKKAYH